MWPLSWYQFSVSLPLEVRTVGLVLFLQVLTLVYSVCRQPVMLSLCSVTACSVQPCVATTVNYLYIKKKQRRKCCLLPVPPLPHATLEVIFCRCPPPPHPFLSLQLIAHLSHLATARNVPRKPRRSRREGTNERRKIKVTVCFRDRLPSDSSSSPTPCRQPAELDFYRFSSAVFHHSNEFQHDTTSVPPSSPPSDCDDLSTSSLSAPLRPPHRQLLHIPLSSSSAENTLLVCLFNARSVGTSRRRSDISTFIQDNDIDIMLLTEIWLRPAGDEAKIADLAPPGYSVLCFPRSAAGSGAKGGGIAFVIRDSLKPHVATTSSFPVHHPCFEAAQLSLTYNKQLTNFFCIYRPLPAKRTKSLTPCVFFKYFF